MGNEWLQLGVAIGSAFCGAVMGAVGATRLLNGKVAKTNGHPLPECAATFARHDEAILSLRGWLERMEERLGNIHDVILEVRNHLRERSR